LRDPEWWTSVAVDLLDWKPGSLAKDVAKLLKKDQQDVARALSSLYRDTFNACLKAQNYAFTVPVAREVATAFDPTEFDPRFPMTHPLFTHLLDHAKQRLLETTGREEETYRLDEEVRQTFGATFNLLRTLDPTRYPGASQYVGY
jgi:hypothetical protein